jgi:hypothetical protein
VPILRQRTAASSLAVRESVALQATLLSLILAASALLPKQGFGIDTCWWHCLFGFNCPSCGLTRSFIASAHGRIADAFGYNWMGPPLFLCTALAWADRMFRLSVHRPLFPSLDTGNPLRIVCWALFMSWVARLLLVGGKVWN